MKKYILLILMVFFAVSCVPQGIPRGGESIDVLKSPPKNIWGFDINLDLPGQAISVLSPKYNADQCSEKKISPFFSKISYYLIVPVKQQIQQISVQIFNNIIRSGSPYSRAVTIVLVLYMAIYGIMFMSNMVEINATDIVSRLFKVGVVLVMMTENAYDFFNKYLFELFTDGAENLLKVVTDPYCGTSSSGQINFFAFIDNVISDFIDGKSYLAIRILSLLFTFPIGWICFYILLICMIRYFFAIIKAMLAYMFAFTAIGFLISMGPIFIVLILFEQTRDFFNNWLKMLMMFALQPVVMFASIFIVSIFIADTIYGVFPPLKWAQISEFVWYTPPIEINLVYLSWYVPDWWCSLWLKNTPYYCFSKGAEALFQNLGRNFIQYLATLGILYILTDILGKIPAFVEEMASRLTSSLGAGVGVQDTSAMDSISEKTGLFAKPDDKKKK